MSNFDYNELEISAQRMIGLARFDAAIHIYLFMADGDPSLDGGYLAERLGQCYEESGKLYEARYWYGRAVEENPHVRLESIQARQRLESAVISEIQDILCNPDFNER